MTEPATETRCPACQTVFAVEAEDLERAGGRVRCGDCLQVFDARANVEPERLIGLIQEAPHVYRFDGATTLRFTADLHEPEQRFEFLRETLGALLGETAEAS